MICLIEVIGGAVTSWTMAHDVPSLRRDAQAAGETELAQELYRMEFTPPPGKYELASGHTMLVS